MSGSSFLYSSVLSPDGTDLAAAKYSAAFNHRQKALAADPPAGSAHEEAMRVFAAQGRREARDHSGQTLIVDGGRQFL